MAYTEIKKRNKNTYYYRVISVRNKSTISKKRIYVGVNLTKEALEMKEREADTKLVKNKIRARIEKIKPAILKILKKYNIRKAGIFGSYARGEEKKKSDIDLLVEPAKGMGLEFVGMGLELEEKMGRKVDLVTYESIHPLLKKKILEEDIHLLPWKEV